ncbi:MAG: hypothetical protein ACFFDT_28330 [Candidatus Hodarchaeota archaeon]
MRVTSVIVLLESGLQYVYTLLYREMRNDSNTALINLYKAWDKPEEAKKWRAKL